MIGAIGQKYFPALTHRDYRLFWTGQCISLIGTWMQTVGQSWLVYQITNSSFLLGLISTLQFTPVLIFSLPVGAIVERLPKKKVLFCVQFCMMLCAFTLAFLSYTGLAAYWNIAIMAFTLGTLNSIDMTVRQSFMVDLASKEHLMNAIALNSTIFNAARIIGPSIAGIVFGYLGAFACFLINGLTFIPVLMNISMIKTEGISPKKQGKINIIKDIAEGLRYILSNPAINTTVMMVALTNVFITNFNVMIPVMARTVIHGDSKTYGYLMTGLGSGAFIGAITLAATSYKGLRIKRLMGAFLGLGVFVFIQGFQYNFYTAFLFFIGAGWCMTTAMSSSNTTLQLNSPNELRARIMSVYSLVLGGAVPLGSLYSGTKCENFGASLTFRVSGAFGIAIMLLIIAFRYRKITDFLNNKDSIENTALRTDAALSR